jgi:hypothetical protein
VSNKVSLFLEMVGASVTAVVVAVAVVVVLLGF